MPQVIRYAVLFKCHFWDGFAKRQVERLTAHAPGGDVFVVVNESGGSAGPIDLDESRVVRVTEDQAREIGLENNPDHDMFWYNGDYHLLLMARRHPDYDYYIVLEHDALILASMDDIVADLARREIDHASQPIPSPVEQWPWLRSCEGVYAPSDVQHRLISIMILSRRATHRLFDRRIEWGEKLRRGEITNWPFSEAAVPTEMHLAGLRMATLEDLGSIRYFNWAPPFLEEALGEMEDAVFVHPVLDTRRFLANADLWLGAPEEFFHPDHTFRQRIVGDAYLAFLPHLHGRLWLAGKFDLARRTVDLMRNAGDEAYLERHGLTEHNIALGKRASQSSLSRFSVGEDEAAGAVTGPVGGHHKFHTEEEARPWWMLDLGGRTTVDEVRVFNRQGNAYCAVGLEMSVSVDGREWRVVAVHDPEVPFGDPVGTAWVVALGFDIRFLRLELPRVGILHLDQVHVIRRGRLRAGTGVRLAVT